MQEKSQQKGQSLKGNDGETGFSLDRESVTLYPGGCFHIRSDDTVLPLNEAGDTLLKTLSAEVLNTFIRQLHSSRSADTFNLILGGITQSRNVLTIPVAEGGWLVFGTDYSLERNLRTALAKSRQRYKDMVELSADYVWEVDSDGRFVFVSAHGFLGHPASQVVGMTPEDFIVGWQKDRPSDIFLTRTLIQHRLLTASSRDGKLLHLVISAKPLFDSDGNWRGSRGVCSDITEEKQSETLLQIKNQLALTIRDVSDPGTMLQIAAEKIAHILGARGSQIFYCSDPDKPNFILKAQHGKPGNTKIVLEKLEHQNLVREVINDWRVMAVICFSHKQINGALCVWRREVDPPWTEEDAMLLIDIANQIAIANEQVATHEHILHLSRTDGLTGMFNRRAFFEELERYIQRLQRMNKIGALIYVDLDNFKLVNDTYGHMMGDQVLQKVRDLLMKHSRPEDLLGRLGGDEFAMWLSGAGRQAAANRCETLLREVEKMAELSGKEEAPFGFSLGIAIYDPKSGETLEELVTRADAAMYTVKRRGKGGLSIAAPSIDPAHHHHDSKAEK